MRACANPSRAPREETLRGGQKLLFVYLETTSTNTHHNTKVPNHQARHSLASVTFP